MCLFEKCIENFVFEGMSSTILSKDIWKIDAYLHGL